MRSLTNPKAIVVDRWPWLIQTGIPAILDYPVRSLPKSWYVIPKLLLVRPKKRSFRREFISGLIEVVYADGLRGRLQGLIRLVRASAR